MLKVELKGTLDEVIQQLICLKSQRIDAYTLYEGHALFSKYISYDYAYLTIHGITYREFLEREQQRLERVKNQTKLNTM